MKRMTVAISAALTMTVVGVVPAFAQTNAPTREQRDSRYQIGMMEGVLEKAVEHGAALMRERLRTVLPADMLLSKSPRARGLRLDGYGVIFYIDVPSLQSAPLWSLQTLDQNNLGLMDAMNSLQAFVKASGDPAVQQALQRIELSVAPLPTFLSGAPTGNVRAMSTSSSANDLASSAAQPASADPILSNPTEEYRTEIKNALMEAMLDYSRGLRIGANEWLSVAAGGNDDQPPLAGIDTDTQTVLISIKGSDLADFLGDKISHEEARQRMDVKVF